MSIKMLHGVRLPHHKEGTVGCVPKRMPVPAVVTIPMSMHIGAPAKPVVKAGDTVKVGQLIAEAGGFVSAPIYSSVSGTVKKVEQVSPFNGTSSMGVIIETDGLQEPYEGLIPPEVTDLQSFVDAVRASGAVGLGGAGFPTAVKLNVKPEQVDYICVNGAECEPYITTDTRTMLDDGELLTDGIRTMLKFYQPKQVYVVIEDNKPQCIKHMKELTAGIDNVTIVAAPSLYPQGGEKVLIYNTTGRVVPAGKLPIDVGCVVINTTTTVAIARYLKTGMPLVEKYVTVDGSAIANPQNVIVPIGAKAQDVIDFCGGFKVDPGKVIFGGPMMGMSMPDTDSIVVKSTNAILCFDKKDAVLPEPTACIKCGRCISHCPLKLMPADIETAYELNKPEDLKALQVNLCMECGCCSFICPARRPLVQVNKLAKQMLNEYNNKLKAEEEKRKAKEAEKEANKA